jgi:phage terminase small subunit
MPTGRPRIPTAIKALKGTLVKVRENSDEPRPRAVVVPAPPDTLSDLEKHFWSRLKAAVEPLNVFTPGDLEGFEAMVRVRARFETVANNPESDVKDFLALSKDVAAWLTKFGLTPQARAGLKELAPSSVTDDLDAFFN